MIINSVGFIRIRILFLLFAGIYSINAVCSQASRAVDERRQWEKVVLEARVIVSKEMGEREGGDQEVLSKPDVRKLQETFRLLDAEFKRRREIEYKKEDEKD